ncbi:LLM class flavin-dependent oxidoreductase [Paraburkholderia hospita]|uniref:LLM class flavin-dependent oxidoreductase n=1 Tax=Paraburkholderia hospita TaxID=169430 RepID=UPI000271AD7A|nr:LLM class flavin-dependent oxidoreductase [Paraburkholderia hospita]EUC18800.1 luciferase family protein [Burkholderia sp. BT03]SKC60863.1 Flavin-dependent oxidoreductase, luciferase family (includes alkanesulfonate monooxygenase SsuD and methylene tetrahydromethanopterin reductase) [Paraburkholderia hospita]SKC93356.1 Flavin-dependent oxidoreductase, luciferase family (includes alkanesulfonate monooxygenase SsuD and methylene tetrahydromethanopterin reductase) [Paraburkholderia hospita]
MYFTLYINPQTPGPEMDGAIMEAAIENAVRADQAGFRGIALTNHHFSNYNTYGNSFMFGAHLGSQIKQAWLLLQVAVAPLINPLELAENANLLDQIWRGRFIMGIGSGGSPLEFEGFGRDPAMRGSLTAEVMDVAARAWKRKPGDPPLEYRTHHDRGILRGRIMPGPYRKDQPLLARAALAEEGWADAGRTGRPLFFGRVGVEGAAHAMNVYDDALAKAGWSREQVEFCKDWTTMQKTVLLADDDDTARQLIDEPLANLHRLSQAAFSAYGDEQRKAVTGVSGDDPAVFRKAFVEGATIIGSPQTFIEKLKQYEGAGVRHVALHMNFGFMRPEVTRRTLDLFIDKVMPKFS